MKSCLLWNELVGTSYFSCFVMPVVIFHKSCWLCILKMSGCLETKVIRWWRSNFYRNINNKISYFLTWRYQRNYFANHAWRDWCSWILSSQRCLKSMSVFKLRVYDISLQFVFMFTVRDLLLSAEKLGRIKTKQTKKSPCK